MFKVEEKNSNYYVSIDGRKPQSFSNKNHLMRFIAEIIGVSILTSDEVNFIKDNNNNLSIAMDNKTKESLENTDWDTENVTHDGIQFNKHFIELKLKVQSLETEILKLKQK